MNTIGPELNEAGRALERLDVDKVQCLKKVVESKPLVEWLRTTIACKHMQLTYLSRVIRLDFENIHRVHVDNPLREKKETNVPIQPDWEGWEACFFYST